MIRLSRDTDLKEIVQLINLCFGKREEAYINLSGRYLLYIVDNKIVAMTGLMANTKYPNGLEIDWTCTHPDYRKRGYMHELFKRLIQLTDENICCSCWRVHNNEKINLSSLMNDFNFKCIGKSNIEWLPTNCGIEPYGYCINYKENCHCYEDLYIRESTNKTTKTNKTY